MTREDVVLLLADGASGQYGLDRFRVMKGCFLVAMLGGPRWDELFKFRAYDYGPFDSSIYSTRDSLKQSGLIEIARPGRYETYRLTDAGAARVQELEETLGPATTEWVRGIGRWVSGKSFSDIARWVYAKYPDYATHSVFR